MIDMPQDGLFVGRIWRAGNGPCLVTLRGGMVVDITSAAAPTMRDLLDRVDLLAYLQSGGNPKDKAFAQ